MGVVGGWEKFQKQKKETGWGAGKNKVPPKKKKQRSGKDKKLGRGRGENKVAKRKTEIRAEKVQTKKSEPGMAQG